MLVNTGQVRIQPGPDDRSRKLHGDHQPGQAGPTLDRQATGIVNLDLDPAADMLKKQVASYEAAARSQSPSLPPTRGRSSTDTARPVELQVLAARLPSMTMVNAAGPIHRADEIRETAQVLFDPDGRVSP